MRQTHPVLEISVLTPDDWPLWRTARLAALADAPQAFGSRLSDWQGDGDREDRWRSRLSLDGSYNLLALSEGVPAGMASGIPGDEPGTAELISMWVAPAARGQHVGDTLIGAIESWAAAAGYRELGLWVKADNAAAIRLYERHGFAFIPGAIPDEDGELPMVRLLHNGD
jgi:ribosomal protein S18 acetylase RimI-like enzyme